MRTAGPILAAAAYVTWLIAPAQAQMTYAASSQPIRTAPGLDQTDSSAPQLAPTTEPQEILVTAQRFAEPLSKTPVTVSALTGAELADRNLTSLADFNGAVPGLQVDNYFGQARINIRGIGQNNLSVGTDSQVAYNLNGVYVGQAFSAAQSFLDLDRIEVLRGPQGTLYGRNATGGAINIITARPTRELFASAEVSGGNFGALDGTAVLSGPLCETVSGRLALAAQHHDGYSLNLFNGKHYDDADWQTLRATLLFDLANNLSLTLIGDYYHRRDGSYATHLLGQSPGFPITGVLLGGHTVPLNGNGQASNPRLLNIDTVPDFGNENRGVSADLDWKINDSLSFKSLSAYRDSSASLTVDFDSTELPFSSRRPGVNFLYAQKTRQVSQELQLIGAARRLRWVTGLYYFQQSIDPGGFDLGINFATPVTPLLGTLQVTGTSRTEAYAAFGQATLELTERLSATAGLRYSQERRSASQLQTVPTFESLTASRDATSFHDFAPKFTLDFQATQQLMLYATLAKGFQSGGFDINNQPPLRAFNPETLWDYEAGLKWHNESLSLDTAGFHYKYSDLQVAQILNGLPYTSNAASSSVNGAELETSMRPLRHLQISAAFTYLDAQFTRFSELNPLTGNDDNLGGHRLPGSARYATNLSAAYAVPVRNYSLTVGGEWNWRDRVFFSEFNSAQVSQAAVHTFNASARFGPDGARWFVELFGKNLTNADIATIKYITGAGFGSMVLGQLAPPRTYGIRLHYQFGP